MKPLIAVWRIVPWGWDIIKIYVYVDVYIIFHIRSDKPQMKPNRGTVLLQAAMLLSTSAKLFHLLCVSS